MSRTASAELGARNPRSILRRFHAVAHRAAPDRPPIGHAMSAALRSRRSKPAVIARGFHPSRIAPLRLRPAATSTQPSFGLDKTPRAGPRGVTRTYGLTNLSPSLRACSCKHLNYSPAHTHNGLELVLSLQRSEMAPELGSPSIRRVTPAPETSSRPIPSCRRTVSKSRCIIGR